MSHKVTRHALSDPVLHTLSCCTSESSCCRYDFKSGGHLISYATDSRSGSLAATNPKDSERDRGLCTDDVYCIRAQGSKGGGVDAWSMRFKTTHHKGLNEILKRVTRHWVLHPFERPENLFLESTPFVLAILMLRRRLREAGGRLITTWEELEASTSLRLVLLLPRQLPLFFAS